MEQLRVCVGVGEWPKKALQVMSDLLTGGCSWVFIWKIAAYGGGAGAEDKA